jgi:hypothetical protein
MSAVRLLCIDVGDADDAAASQAVTRAVAMASEWDRLLCFGKAAVVAGRLERQERAERDGVWLDLAAQWLLANDPIGGPPTRPATGPLARRAAAIGRSGLDAGLLPVSERLVELVGTLLVMAVPSPKHIDDVDNAHLWLVGGTADDAALSRSKAGGRAVVGVGGSVVGAVVEGSDVTISRWSLLGALVGRTRLAWVAPTSSRSGARTHERRLHARRRRAHSP